MTPQLVPSSLFLYLLLVDGLEQTLMLRKKDGNASCGELQIEINDLHLHPHVSETPASESTTPLTNGVDLLDLNTPEEQRRTSQSQAAASAAIATVAAVAPTPAPRTVTPTVAPRTHTPSSQSGPTPQPRSETPTVTPTPAQRTLPPAATSTQVLQLLKQPSFPYTVHVLNFLDIVLT